MAHVTTEKTLERARAELASGAVAQARQRLRGLVGSQPHNLVARELRAQTYRGGDTVQAGRWAYLSPSLTETEEAAFGKGFADDPVRMMRALAWRGSEEDASTDLARERLRTLRARAEEAAGTRLTWEQARYPDPPSRRLAAAGGVAAALFLLLCLGVGVVTVIRAVIGWW